MKLAIFTFCSLILLQGSASSLSIKDYIEESKDIIFGIISNVASFFPTPSQLFGGGKNVIAAYPLEFLSTTMNAFCSALMFSKSIKSKITPDINSMHFQLRTSCKRYSYPLLYPNNLLKNPEFNVSKKTVILVTGWQTTINNSDAVTQLAKAYNCRGDVNFLALDVASYVDTLFTWAALNTDLIGEYLGQGLAKLSELMPLENIHLIGHSLGAHICGVAGRTFTDLTNKKVPRITGLDPAKPCFNEGEDLSGLMRGDADFIDVIHTNAGVLGKREPIGDVDFYPDGLVPLPKGCFTVTCAHERSWLYFTETVYPGNENNFMARRCSSLVKLKQNKCLEKAAPMGYAAPSTLNGNYFLEVRGGSPFGLNGNKSRDERNVYCGLCTKVGDDGSSTGMFYI